MGSATKIKEMRKKLKALEVTTPTTPPLQSQDQTQTSIAEALPRLVLGLTQKVFLLERKARMFDLLTRKTDYRTVAMLHVMNTRLPGFRAEVEAYAEILQIKDFEKEAALEAKSLGIVRTDEPVAEGYFAVCSVKIFKSGKELEEERVIRSRIEIGKRELFPELDDVLTGMKSGETKRFPLNLQNQTDEGEVTVIEVLKRQAPAAEESA